MRMLPSSVAPDDRVSVKTYTLAFAEFHDFVSGRSSPVGLHLWILAIVPELLRVPVLGCEAQAVRLHLESLPIESDGRGIEQCPVQFLIPFVALVGAELVEVEDMGSEYEVVGDLFDPDLRPVWEISEVNHGVSLPVRFNVGVDFGLYLGIPDIPVLLAHNPVLVFLHGFREWGLGGNAEAQADQGGCQNQFSHHLLFHGKFYALQVFIRR